MQQMIINVLKDYLSKYTPEEKESALSSITELIRELETTHNGRVGMVLEQFNNEMVVNVRIVRDGRSHALPEYTQKPLSEIIKQITGKHEIPMMFNVILPIIPGFINGIFKKFRKELKPKKLLLSLQNDKIMLQLNEYEIQTTTENGQKFVNQVLVGQKRYTPNDFMEMFETVNLDDLTI